MNLDNLPPISLPMPWHEHEWIQLQKQFVSGQLPHALLLVGGKSTGKSQFALALSRLLLCAHDGSLNCGSCHACELSAKRSHGDFQWVQPLESSRSIRIEQVRDVLRFTNRTAGYGLRKVIVLAPAESMNINAFNALLKSLEEPADDTHWILVCHNLHGVPATIRSRCQILRFATPSSEACLEWLDLATGNREQSRYMLSLTDGLPLLAHEIHCSGEAKEFADRRMGLQKLLRGQVTMLEAAAPLSEMDTGLFLDQLSQELQQLLGTLPLEQLRTRRGKNAFRLLDKLMQLRQAVNAGANPNKQLVAEVLLSMLSRELGADSVGANIPEQRGETGV